MVKAPHALQDAHLLDCYIRHVGMECERDMEMGKHHHGTKKVKMKSGLRLCLRSHNLERRTLEDPRSLWVKGQGCAIVAQDLVTLSSDS
mmetsp:Transcript_122745/g.192677  ORF Transcript_122745/g.192677 Transcript_122745/m.192677 type:complete len:89 (+) Transcript_122745:431-697(+)